MGWQPAWRWPQARAAASRTSPGAGRRRAAFPGARDAEDPSGYPVAALGPLRAGGRAQLPRELRPWRLPPRALHATAQPRAPDRGGYGCLRPRAGNEGDRFTTRKSREPGLRATWARAARALPAPGTADPAGGPAGARVRASERPASRRASEVYTGAGSGLIGAVV